MSLIIFFPKKFLLFSFIITINFWSSNVLAQNHKTGKSEWVYFNSQNKLAYKTLLGGDKIMDFSYAGYMGGGVRIPSVEAKITLSPKEGDNTEAIQNAIDEVSKMKMINGLRGAVVLKLGIYNCEKPISINASGVVLRGSGAGKNGTVINMTGNPHV